MTLGTKPRQQVGASGIQGHAHTHVLFIEQAEKPTRRNGLIGVHLYRREITGEHDAGRPSSLDDFYKAHGLCLHCRGSDEDSQVFVG